MPPRRWRMGRRTPLTPEIGHVLASGCYGMKGEFSFDAFLLVGHVLQGHLEQLEELWAIHGAAVKAQHAGETFAELVLRGGDWRARWGRLHCPEHPAWGETRP